MDAVLSHPASSQQNIEIEIAVQSERSRLLNFIRTRVRNEDDAQDILQDVLGSSSRRTDGVRRLSGSEPEPGCCGLHATKSQTGIGEEGRRLSSEWQANTTTGRQLVSST
jgi:hypothetical protein